MGARLVARRDRRERGAERLPGPWVDRRRPGRPVAAAEQVGCEDADPVGVERPARTDEGLPPVAGRVGRPGQRVDDHDLRRCARGADRHAGMRRSAREASSRRPARTDRAPPIRDARYRSVAGPPPVRGAPTVSRPRLLRASSGQPAAPTRSPSADESRQSPPPAPARGRRGGRRRARARPIVGRDRRSCRSRSAPRPSVASAWSMPDG